MAFTKITSEDTANKGVVGLADTPNLSTQEMQKKFDELATDVIIPKFNKLSDELDSKSIDKKVSSEEITNIRINEDKQLETSNDGGVTWEATASSGHIIENGAGTQYPARARLQFSDNVVISDNPQQNKTFISVPAGEKGDKGESATITIGNVASGDEAQVENVGSDTDAIFNFTFPRGEHGSAATIRVGTVQSGENASVSNSGTTSDAIFNFVLPKGEKGDTGTSFQIKGMYATYDELIAAHPTGSRGDAYAVGTSEQNVIYNWNNDTKAWDNLGGLKGAKGDTGESATITVGTVTKGATTNVENVGTSEHAILNFTLEQGAKGEKGDSATVSVGSVEQGDYPEVINVGTPQNAILNFKLQKGEKGEQGNPTVVNGKNGVNINLYATDIDMSDKEATKVSEKISNVSTSVNTLSNKVTTLEADVVKNTSVLTLEEINAGTEAELADKVPNANALKEVNNSFVYDENGIYGYRRKVDGADTVFPFSSKEVIAIACKNPTTNQPLATGTPFYNSEYCTVDSGPYTSYGNTQTITFSKKCNILLFQTLIIYNNKTSVKITLNDNEILNYSPTLSATIANYYKQTKINVNAGDILKVIYTVANNAYVGGQTVLVV